jgi:antitoxin component YwqK of YwqJK toxin-antitoxin module
MMKNFISSILFGPPSLPPFVSYDAPHSDYNHIVYKSAQNTIVTLGLPPFSKTNFDRSGVKDDKYACFRVKCADVLKIEDKQDGTSLTKITSDFNSDFIYKVGQRIVVNDYDEDIEKVAGKGIHVFKSKEAALYHGHFIPSSTITYRYVCFGNDGAKVYSTEFKNGVKHGEEIWYYHTGNVWQKHLYSAGLYHGMCEIFNDRGDTVWICYFNNGKKEGIEKQFDFNTLVCIYQCHFKDGEKEGSEIYYNSKGERTFEMLYENGFRRVVFPYENERC